MGNLKDLASMLPGMGKLLKNVDIPDDVFKQTEAIISSMTPAERDTPRSSTPGAANASQRVRERPWPTSPPDEAVRRHAQDDESRSRRGMKMPKVPGGGMFRRR